MEGAAQGEPPMICHPYRGWDTPRVGYNPRDIRVGYKGLLTQSRPPIWGRVSVLGIIKFSYLLRYSLRSLPGGSLSAA